MTRHEAERLIDDFEHVFAEYMRTPVTSPAFYHKQDVFEQKKAALLEAMGVEVE